jgi:cytochrome b
MKVWDLPTRLFHWSIVLLVAFAWWSGENHEMEWHYRFGLTALGLVLFRLVWGLIGGSTAQFAHFVRSPAAVVAYLRDKTAPDRPGHNPLGGYSVIAMLLALSVQVGTGLFATDTDGLESGPLSYLVDFDQGRVAAEIHEFSFNLLLALVIVHIGAVAWYRLRGKRLLGPMITGRDPRFETGEAGLVPAGLVRFVVAAALALAIAWYLSNGLSFTPQ